MEFYRKAQKRSRIKSLLKKIFRIKRRSVLALLGILLFSFLFFANNGIIARVKLEQRRTEMIEKVLQSEEETKQLQAQVKALEGDKKTIEKVAREKYGMMRDGEKVYRVKKD